MMRSGATGIQSTVAIKGAEDLTATKDFIKAMRAPHGGAWTSPSAFPVSAIRASAWPLGLPSRLAAGGRASCPGSWTAMRVLFLDIFAAFARAHERPQLLLSCAISLIPKQETAQTAADLRPMAVLSVVYRGWSSAVARRLLAWATASFLPAGIKGGLKGREPMDCYLEVAFEIEAAWLDGVSIAGATADVIKFFDRLPREVVAHACVCLGIPVSFVQAWSAHLSGTVRHFQVGGGLGRPRCTTRGTLRGMPCQCSLPSLRHLCST